MDAFEYTSHTGPDGALDLHVNLGLDQANRAVKIVVQPVDIRLVEKMTHEEWVRFLEQTAGSINDPTFVRHDQGQLEDRGEIFP